MLFIITIGVISCKKGNDSKTDNNAVAPAQAPVTQISSPGKLTIFKDINLANDTDALQSVFKPINTDIIFSFYGSYSTKGTPSKIKEIVATQGQNSEKIILDDSLRVKVSFFTNNNVKDSTVLFYRYLSNKIIITMVEFDWVNSTEKLKSIDTINSNNYSNIGAKVFSSRERKYILNIPSIQKSSDELDSRFSNNFIYSKKRITLNNQKNNTHGPIFRDDFSDESTDDTNYGQQVSIGVTAIITMNAATVAMDATIGALIFGLVGQPVLGAAIGAGYGVLSAIYSSANLLNGKTQVPIEDSSNINSDYSSYSANPQTDLLNTQLANEDIGLGVSDTGPEDIFSSDCVTNGETNISYLEVVIKLNKSNTEILDATYFASYNFTYSVNSPTSLYGPFGGQPMAANSNIVGKNVNIYWIDAWGYTNNLSGEIAGNTIVGDFYFNSVWSCTPTTGGHQLITSPISVIIEN